MSTLMQGIQSAPPIRFTREDAYRAAEAWKFSCGPAALCALFGLKPDDIRPHLGDFKGFMNPTNMYAALRSICAADERSPVWGLSDRVGPSDNGLAFPKKGIARIQWNGPWMQPRVPVPARYSRTHWVASWQLPGEKTRIYDVNDPGGWSKLANWKTLIVPLLLEEVPRADGTWTVTHTIEVSL